MSLMFTTRGDLMPPCPVPTYLGVKLDRSLTFHHHPVVLRKKLSIRVALLRRLAGSGWGAGAKTLRISALSLVYFTAEYCAPVWCRSTHTRLIDSILNDVLRMATGCLRPTPTEDLPVLAGIQPAELRRLGSTLSLANRAVHDPEYVLHGKLVGQQDAHLGRLSSRRPFVPAAWKLLGSLSELDIRVKQWTNHKWNADLESISRVRAFIPRVSLRPLGISLPRTTWVRLNRQRTSVGRFHSSMYKWGLTPSPNCECGATEQTADHIISSCLIHHDQEQHEVCRFWMTQLDVGLTPPLPTSHLGSAAARVGKRIDPHSWLGFVLARIEFGCLTKRPRRIMLGLIRKVITFLKSARSFV